MQDSRIIGIDDPARIFDYKPSQVEPFPRAEKIRIGQRKKILDSLADAADYAGGTIDRGVKVRVVMATGALQGSRRDQRGQRIVAGVKWKYAKKVHDYAYEPASS